MIGSPAGMAIAAMTVMLWIIWSDTIRTRRPTIILYSIRVLLFLAMSGVLVFNRYRLPWLYTSSTRALTYLAAGVGVLGAVYFGRKLVVRR
jgi:hypothetical protein